MANITAQDVQRFRAATGAGMMDAKRALEESGGDVDRAVDALRKKGAKVAAARGERATSQGLVESYVHGGGTLGVLVEVACETDFVARTDKFKELAHDIAMQVAATNPQYIAVDDVPADVIVREREVYLGQLKEQGKQGPMVEKIVEGKLEKFYEEACLLKQPFFKDDTKKVQDVVNETITATGENIKIKRFARFTLSGRPSVAGSA